MKRIGIFLCLALLASHATAQGDSAVQNNSAPRKTIRVGVWTLWHDKEVTITSISRAMVRPCESCRARPFTTITLHTKNDNVMWTDPKGSVSSSSALLLTSSVRLSAHGETLTLDAPLKMSAQHGELLLVATLPLERYVEFVIASESGAADTLESRKAMAVVVRSFALAPKHRHNKFDVCDSTHCQWVHWHTNPAAHAATLATADESLWRNGIRAEAYFHQNCGGRTATAEEVWPGHGASNHAALISRSDPYCQRVGSSEWSSTLSRTELTQALSAAGLIAPGWKNLSIVQRGTSGRATVLLIGVTKISAEKFRLAVGRALGWNRIRSNWFEVTSEGDNFHFHGRGSGHGVGLCQVGAAEMSHEGRSYREILAQYFPGTTLAEETTGAAWQTFAGQGFTVESSEASDAAYLPIIARALSEAEARSGLTTHTEITLRGYRSTSAFRDATLAPGWVAAFTEGDLISTQPLHILSARKLLPSVLLHEFLHTLIEGQSTAQTPLWLREGLVEALSGDARQGSSPALTLEQVNEKLAYATSETESEAAHRADGWYCQQLLDHFGRTQILEWLRTGIPPSALTILR